MAASSSSSSGSRRYDVFLNFRVEDTRRHFVCHLHKALELKAINTFIDSDNLISKLLNHIEDSKLSIVVLSENYASSTWCLKELVKILECMDTNQQIVLPIFYRVDPSDLRRVHGKFAQAFAKHGENPYLESEELARWRSAITRVGGLSGWDSCKYEDDGMLIEKVVEDTRKKMYQTSPSKASGLVGMDSHIAEMDSRLCLKRNDVRLVGIWGMGGLEKTTIARCVFDKISHQFEHSCFLDNVKEAFISKHEVEKQAELLSGLLMANVQSVSLYRGRNMILERLGTKRVLVVLDDVEEFAQIEVLLGDLQSFGVGSRIILTTRNMESLRGGYELYNPKLLRDEEALQLFMKHAFRTNQFSAEYGDLSKRAIKYAQGLPLALKVLGAWLDRKGVLEWENVLEKIRETPHKGIQGVLRTSFDALYRFEKDIFLDIACIFKNWEKDFVTELLASFGFFPYDGLRVLVDRALITKSDYDNVLDTHDLLQEMGREIVRLESLKEPGKRSRLWSYEDVSHILSQNTVRCLL